MDDEEDEHSGRAPQASGAASGDDGDVSDIMAASPGKLHADTQRVLRGELPVWLLVLQLVLRWM